MTSPSPLDRLAGLGKVLGKEAPDAKEFDGLVHSGLARLKDAEKEANSLEGRFDLAYRMRDSSHWNDLLIAGRQSASCKPEAVAGRYRRRCSRFNCRRRSCVTTKWLLKI